VLNINLKIQNTTGLIKKAKMTSGNRASEVRTSQKEPEREQRIYTFKDTQLIWLLLGIFEALIALRIVMIQIGANSASPIVALIYGFTGLFLFPVTGLITSPTAGNMVLDLSSMLVYVCYALIAWALVRIVWLTFYHQHGPMSGFTESANSEHPTNP
jgi:hypothetical protein